MRAWRKQFWGSLSGGQKRGERPKSRPPFCKFVNNMYRRWFCLHISGYMKGLPRQSRWDWLKPECHGRSHLSDVTCSGPPSKFVALTFPARGYVLICGQGEKYSGIIGFPRKSCRRPEIRTTLPGSMYMAFPYPYRIRPRSPASLNPKQPKRCRATSHGSHTRYLLLLPKQNVKRLMLANADISWPGYDAL